jgi:CBS domain containing-hemolysin-like protein
MNAMSTGMMLTSLVILLGLSAFFSASETALFALSRARVRQLRDRGGVIGRTIAGLLNLPRRLLITILLGNLLVNTAVSSIIANFVTRHFGAEALGIAVAITTPLLLVFGEVTPKTLAILRPMAVAKVFALPLSFCAVLCTPLRVVLRWTTNALLLLLRQGHVQSDALLTQEEFQATLHTGKVTGGINANEAEIIHAIASFHSTVAREIMVPRPEIVALKDTDTLEHAIAVSRRVRHPRLPVYRGTIDHIVAVLNVKALPAWRAWLPTTMVLRDVWERLPRIQPAPPRALMTPPLLAPETRAIDGLLNDFRARGEHIAIILDEYGGTAGMLTRDNIFDALLGGMVGCTPRRTFLQTRPNGDMLVSGCYRLDQLNWECGFQFDDDDDDTVAGYVTRIAGSMPQQGQVMRDKLVDFTVVQMTGHRIDLVLLHTRAPEHRA